MLTAFRTTASPRMMVAVSLNAEDLLANWRREAVMAAASFVSAAVLLGATLLVVFRQMAAKSAVEAALERTRAEEAERLRAANDGTGGDARTRAERTEGSRSRQCAQGSVPDDRFT
jgi:hypothetical protein